MHLCHQAGWFGRPDNSLVTPYLQLPVLRGRAGTHCSRLLLRVGCVCVCVCGVCDPSREVIYFLLTVHIVPSPVSTLMFTDGYWPLFSEARLQMFLWLPGAKSHKPSKPDTPPRHGVLMTSLLFSYSRNLFWTQSYIVLGPVEWLWTTIKPSL